MSERVSIIVPTLNPGDCLSTLCDAIGYQRLKPLEILVVDSSSTDALPVHGYGEELRVITIDKAAFDHGGTRNLGARQARGEILVFMTQDATPADDLWLENLVAPILSGEAVATFARQLPREGATPLERFARHFNYPPTSKIKTIHDVQEMGFKAFFFSNVCSAVRANGFWEVGGFPQRVVMDEDVLLCARLMRVGYRVKYTAEARVFHSHNYTLRQQFKRNFDIGAFVAQSADLLENAPVGGEGARLVMGQTRYVIQEGSYLNLFAVFTEAAVKLAGFSLGRKERWLPVGLKRLMSMHSSFWR